jgi:Ca2+/Na+ antiporter
MEAGALRPGYELWRPNREKPEAKSARALVVFLLLVTAGLSFVIIIGGWSRLEGVKALTIIYAALYVLFAFLVARWNRGVLPVASALSIILAIFAGIAAPAWFDRAKDGLSDPALPPELLGLLCLVLVPIQVILIAVAMVAFNQDWHVEEERPIGDEVPPAEPAEEEEEEEEEEASLQRSRGRRSGTPRATRSTGGAATRRPRKA